MPIRCLVLLFSSLSALAPALLQADEPANLSQRKTPTVAVWAEASHLADLAERVADEIERLLQSETDPWTVDLGTPPDGDQISARIAAASESGASIAVVVGPTDKDLRSFPTQPSIPVVWVDALGRLHAPSSDASAGDGAIVGRIATAAAMESRFEEDLSAFHQLLLQTSSTTPSRAPKILVLIEPYLADVGPTIQRVGREAGVSVQLAELPRGIGKPQAKELATVLDDAPVSIDGAYLPPGLSHDAALLAEALTERRFASFSGRGRSDVEAGILAGRPGRGDQPLARLAAVEVLAMIRGLPTPSAKMTAAETDHDSNDRLVINLSTAAALNLDIPWRLRLSAETLGQESAAGQVTTLVEARLEALEANLDLRARDLSTAASEEDIRRALASMRPKLTVATAGRWIDPDSAAASFGTQPERLVTAIGEASWILFSEDARAAVDVTRRIQTARLLELGQLRLDLGLEASAGLLEVARTRAFEAIERDNLALTLAELDAARTRRSAGAGGRADVARLEARAARDRSTLVRAYGRRRAVEVSFNRLLSRPLDQEVVPKVHQTSTPEKDPAIPLPLESILARPGSFTALSRELLARARERAPEIAAAREVVEARQRETLAARRAFYLPTFQALAQVETRLVEGGAGLEPPSAPGGGEAFPQPPDTTWSLGLNLSLPLLDGGARDSQRVRTQLDLDAARLLQRSAEQRVEERLRLALLGLETSYEAAKQARMAATAARHAFDVVDDGYNRGTETLTTLLDAQTELLVSRQRRATAAYDALGRWFALQRATGEFFDDASVRELSQRFLTGSAEDATTHNPENNGTVNSPSVTHDDTVSQLDLEEAP